MHLFSSLRAGRRAFAARHSPFHSITTRIALTFVIIPMFTPTYKDWPTPHKRLLFSMLVALCAILLFVWLYLLPTWQSYKTDLANYRQKYELLQNSKWPGNSLTLKNHLTYCQELLNGYGDTQGLAEVSNSVIAHATGNFQEQIAASFVTEKDDIPDEGRRQELLNLLVERATRIDYKDICDRVEHEFQDSSLKLNPATFELKEDASIPIYQMIVRIWTVQTILQLAASHSLLPATVDDFSDISPLPVIYYALSTKDALPYLLELPVRFHLRGKLLDFIQFTKTLQTHERFFPLTQLEISHLPPNALEHTITLDTVDFTFVCSTFLEYPSTPQPQPAPASQTTEPES